MTHSQRVSFVLVLVTVAGLVAAVALFTASVAGLGTRFDFYTGETVGGVPAFVALITLGVAVVAGVGAAVLYGTTTRAVPNQHDARPRK